MADNGLQFGAFVRREREAKEIGLREMAKKIGVSPTYLSKVEHFPHDQKRPFIADLRNGARDGAGLRRKVRAAHQKSLLFLN
jgi:transcriptional regulator with XRE-family HTH domain